MYIFFSWGGGLSSPESESKSKVEMLDLQANPVADSLNDCESDWIFCYYDPVVSYDMRNVKCDMKNIAEYRYLNMQGC